ncbi:DUF4183 domain-containing protein [Cohnella cholangitidis]|uniref:DUF4183 domain-containing protein n=2 Tax=Cohnella cholangitidis TaxID=2598458 RepID=A0A7G5BV09_9BACL|nr:DUF4183 domain-containing protein [Cohnella cholangitidis]
MKTGLCPKKRKRQRKTPMKKKAIRILFNPTIVMPQGEQGKPGAHGTPGEQGDPGIQGAPGEQGLQGIPGPQGEQGARGSQGSRGPRGHAGADISAVNVIPAVRRYFYVADSDIPMNRSRTFTADQFVDDAGDRALRFTLNGQNGYCNLYINAVMQEGQLYSLAPDALTIKPTGQLIRTGTPIILESVGFTAEMIPKL